MKCPPEHSHNERCRYVHGCSDCERCKEKINGLAIKRYRKRRLRDRKNTTISARGSMRRLQALACMGWGINDAIRETGITQVNLTHIRNGRKRDIHITTHLKIVKYYEEFAWQRKEGHYGELARRRAKELDWYPPAAWENIDRDEHAFVDLFYDV